MLLLWNESEGTVERVVRFRAMFHPQDRTVESARLLLLLLTKLLATIDDPHLGLQQRTLKSDAIVRTCFTRRWFPLLLNKL